MNKTRVVSTNALMARKSETTRAYNVSPSTQLVTVLIRSSQLDENYINHWSARLKSLSSPTLIDILQNNDMFKTDRSIDYRQTLATSALSPIYN